MICIPITAEHLNAAFDVPRQIAGDPLVRPSEKQQAERLSQNATRGDWEREIANRFAAPASANTSDANESNPLPVEGSFGTRHTGRPRIVLDRHSQAASGALEDGLGDVMVVTSVMDVNVEVAQRVGGQRLPKVFDQFRIEFTDLLGGERRIENQEVASAQIPNGAAQSLFHWQSEVTIASDSLFVANRLADRLTNADTSVFDGVMLIDMQIAGNVDVEIKTTMPREELQHVIEKPDTS